MKRYATSTNSEQRSNIRNCLFGLLQNASLESIIDAILVSRAEELNVWMQLIKKDPKQSMAAIEQRRLSLGHEFTLDRQGEARAAACANLLLTEYGLGATQNVWPHLAIANDPRVRSYFVHQLCRTEFSLNPLIDRLMDPTDSSIQYAILVAISQCSPKQLGEENMFRVQAWLLDAYAHNPDCGVHAQSNAALELSQAELTQKIPSGVHFQEI